MFRTQNLVLLTLLFSLFSSLTAQAAPTSDASPNTSLAADTLLQSQAKQLIFEAMNLWRGESSYSVTEMEIHRPDWQRTMKMAGWSRGMKDSMIRFTYPPKEVGNANLKLDTNMWIFTPKLNRVTKLPASMMTQSWMGSDFSYNDLAKSDQVIYDYTHRLLAVESLDGHKVYVIEAIPKEDAPIVWGKEVVRVRDDFILMQNDYYDQSMNLVKTMKTLKITDYSGRPFPSVMRVSRVDKPDYWTEIRTTEAWFDIALPDHLFTVANLKQPRAWQPPVK